VRSINSSQASILKALSELQKIIELMNTGFKETREKRYQEEIDDLELKVLVFEKQLNEKRATKESGGSTSERIRPVVMDVLTQRDQAELKRKQIDWIDVRNKVVIVFVIAIVLYAIPWIGQLLQIIFASK
jgi:hypothetical protein